MVTEEVVMRDRKRSRIHRLRIAATLAAIGACFCLATSRADAAFVHTATPSTFGSAGSGDGQLRLGVTSGESQRPGSGIAVDQQTGDVYVADTDNDRIAEFSATGLFIRAFGADVGGPGVDVCTSGCAAGTPTDAPGGFTHPVLVAVDNSSGPSEGDVYVATWDEYPELESTKPADFISKFTSAGNLISSWASGGQLAGLGGERPGVEARWHSIRGLAVDSSGDLIVADAQAGPVTNTFYPIRKFNESGQEVGFATQLSSNVWTVGAHGIFVDAGGNVILEAGGRERNSGLFEIGEGAEESPVPLFETATHPLGVAREGLFLGSIDPSSEGLYALQVLENSPDGTIDHFSSACEDNCAPLERFGAADLSSPTGIATDDETGTVYVANAGDSDVVAFPASNIEPAPVVAQDAPSAAYSTAQVAGTVDPDGHATTCQFEYVSEEDFQASSFHKATAQPCVAQPGSGSTAVSVEAALTGLQPGTTYHSRLAAQSVAGLDYSTLQSFETKAVSRPSVSIEPVSGISATAAHFAGKVDPNAPGPAPQDPAFDVSWHFVCTPECPVLEGTVTADDIAHEVEATASSLEPGRGYQVELVAENAGGKATAESAGPVTFITPAVVPAVSISFPTAVGMGNATLNSRLDPGGAATTVHFEYLSEAEYLAAGESFSGAHSTPESEAVGSADEEHSASTSITGLSAGTTYVFRIAAHNEIGTTYGPPARFFTFSGLSASSGCSNEGLRVEDGSLALPDCRAYEPVSAGTVGPVSGPTRLTQGTGLLSTYLPMKAAAEGDEVAYAALAPEDGSGGGGGNATGDQYLASRTEAGWRSVDVEPTGSGQETGYEFFSSDLSHDILAAGPHQSALTEGVETECPLLYAGNTASGSFGPLYASEAGACHRPVFVAESADGSARVFESAAAKLPGMKKGPGSWHENIYDSVAGSLFSVNVLPDGKAEPDATVGRLTAEVPPSSKAGDLPPLDVENVVSEDGSRIVWTALGSGVVYVRENPVREEEECASPQPESRSCTVQVSEGPAEYQTATPDGRYIYYIEGGRLFRFDVATRTRSPLTVAGAGVLDVLGLNRTGEPGSYLYFIAEGALAGDAQSRACAPAAGGQEEREEEAGVLPAGHGCNLYLLHDGQTTLVTTLLAGDDRVGPSVGSGAYVGDWRSVPGYRTSQLSPDGTRLAFLSWRRLTTYDPRVGSGRGCRVGETECDEIYVYDAEGGALSCASCAPSGGSVEADGGELDGGAILPPRLESESIDGPRRLLSNSGRLFFETGQALVPEDSNQLPDVYEWEPSGVGGCANGSPFDDGGCVYLLSGGRPGQSSPFVESSEGGDDVFFISRTEFAGSDRGETPSLYDARVGGGFAAPPGGAPCESAGCRGQTSVPPATSSPGSAQFSGLGNTTTVPCKKGFLRKGSRCVKKAGHHKKKGHGKHRGAHRHKARRTGRGGHK
jgi:DNA-binding beta-propeller fold protein YncE